MQSESAAAFMGRSVPRLEDAKLLRGAGRFVDDIDLPHLLHATLLASAPVCREFGSLLPSAAFNLMLGGTVSSRARGNLSRRPPHPGWIVRFGPTHSP